MVIGLIMVIAYEDKLPDDAITLLNNGNESQAVAFAYPFGNGTEIFIDSY